MNAYAVSGEDDRVSADPDARTAELAEHLRSVRDRITAACAAAGRDPEQVTLVAVTKTHPAGDVVRLAGLGVTDVGENRDQEAAPKAAEVAAQGAAVRWHFVGRLQRNKCRSVVRYADLVHSVDSVRLAAALGRSAAELRERPLAALVQVSVDRAEGRGGVSPERALEVAEAIAVQPALRVRGVMTVAPMDWRPERAFEVLAQVSAELRTHHPGATVISAGMSGDLDSALAHGATHLRIGTALLGNRPTLR